MIQSSSSVFDRILREREKKDRRNNVSNDVFSYIKDRFLIQEKVQGEREIENDEVISNNGVQWRHEVAAVS